MDRLPSAHTWNLSTSCIRYPSPIEPHPILLHQHRPDGIVYSPNRHVIRRLHQLLEISNETVSVWQLSNIREIEVSVWRGCLPLQVQSRRSGERYELDLIWAVDRWYRPLVCKCCRGVSGTC